MYLVTGGRLRVRGTTWSVRLCVHSPYFSFDSFLREDLPLEKE